MPNEIEKKFNRVFTQNKDVIRYRCEQCGFRDDDLDDAVQDVGMDMFATMKRGAWPETGNERAFVSTFAKRSAIDLQRKVLAKKRKRDDDDWRKPQVTRPKERPRVEPSFDPRDHDPLVHREIDEAMRVLVAAAPLEHQPALNHELDGDLEETPVSRKFGKHSGQESRRALRRIVGVPVENPSSAGVKDPVAHVLEVARRLRTNATDNTALKTDESANEVNSCASDSSNAHSAPAKTPTDVTAKRAIATFPQRTFRRARTSGAVGATPMPTASASTQSAKSPRPPSASVHSPRPAPSAPASGGSATSANEPIPAHRDGHSTPIPQDLASAPTKPSPKRAEATPDESAIEDEEPSFSGGSGK